MNLRSNDDTWKLVEHRVPRSGFTNRFSKYCAPRLYKTLPKTIRQLENNDTFQEKTKNIQRNF